MLNLDQTFKMEGGFNNFIASDENLICFLGLNFNKTEISKF